MTRPLRLAATLAALTLVVIAGCSAPAPAEPPPAVAQAAGPGAPVQVPGQPELTTEEAISDIETAISVVDGFWATHWGEHFTGTYAPPQMYGVFDGSAQYPSPTCTVGSTVETLGPENAFFCPDTTVGPYVAFGDVMMSRAFELGDSFLYLVVAHEWGHAITDQLNADLAFEAFELQADCLAGATLYGAVADGTLLLEEGDVGEITNGLTSVADELPWGDAAVHGDPFERIESFNLGRTSGIEPCLNSPSP